MTMKSASLPLLSLHCCVYIITLVVTATSASAASAPVSINPKEGKALLGVLASWKATPKRKKLDDTWSLKNTCDKWAGIKCDSQGHVISIDMRGRGLEGSLGDDIGQLPYLETLTLGQNYLTGSIPAAIGGCKSLNYLDINLNFMSGPLPSSLGNLKMLEDLILGFNQFTGSIPSSLGGLKSIKRLFLQNNNFTGTLPSSLGQLTTLHDLELSYNFITGTIPSALSRMSSLQRLHLRNNDLYGSLPPSLAKLNLISLSVSGNQLSGPIPSEFGTVYSLQVLSVRGNYFTGPIPTSVNNLPHLSGRSFGINCLTYPSGWKGAQDKQRPTSKCKEFCSANSAVGPCGGNGACTLNSKGVPTCVCNAGFALGKRSTTCVAVSVTSAIKTSSSTS